MSDTDSSDSYDFNSSYDSSQTDSEEEDSYDELDQNDNNLDIDLERQNILLYDSNLDDFDIYNCQIPSDLPESFHEKFEIENLIWSISQESLNDIKKKAIEFLGKNKNNQIFLCRLIDNIISAKPKLIELLFQVYDSICEHAQVDYDLMSESGYFDCYFYYKMFLYPKDTIMYHTVMDDLNSFQQEEVKHNGAPFSKYVEFAENEESLLDLAAKFGSVNIFKYLVMSHPEIPMSSQTFNSAVQGGNLEIIRYTMQYTKTSSVSLNKAVKFNNIELVDWMINEYQTLPSIYVTMINVTRFFFPLLDRMKYSPIREQQFAIEAALTNGHEELALYILKKFGNGKMDFKSIINLMIDRDYDEFIKFFLELPYITKKKDIRSIIDNFIIANHPISKEYLSYQIFKQNIDVLAKYSMKNLNVFKFLYDNGFDLENFYFEKYGNNFYDQFHINSQELRDARPELADAFKIVLEKCTDEAKILNQYLVKVLKSGNTYLLESLKNLKKFKKVLNDFDRDGFLLKFNSTLSTEFIGKMFEMMSGNHYDPHKSLIHLVCRRALRFDHIDTIYSFYSEKNCLDFRSNTPFYLLVSCRKYDLALQIFEKYFAEIDLNVKNSKGMTPLLLAVINYRNGNRRLYDLIYLMVKYGAEPEIQSAHGVTAISVIKNTNRKSDLHKLFPGYFDN